jgi:hypothetical protein
LAALDPTLICLWPIGGDDIEREEGRQRPAPPAALAIGMMKTAISAASTPSARFPAAVKSRQIVSPDDDQYAGSLSRAWIMRKT